MNIPQMMIVTVAVLIVVVIVRGFVAARRSRRGQLVMALDQNIPMDVDPDALEWAELPNGGARVVGRGGKPKDGEQATSQPWHDEALERARSGAEELEPEVQAPVLMEPVSVDDSSETDAEHGVAGGYHAEPAFGADELDEEAQREDADEDADSVLLDFGMDDAGNREFGYDEADPHLDEELPADEEEAGQVVGAEEASAADGLAAVMPDYGDAGHEDDRDHEDGSDHDEHCHDEDPYHYADCDPEQIPEPVAAAPEPGSETDAGDFSMTAGERISGNREQAQGKAWHSRFFRKEDKPGNSEKAADSDGETRHDAQSGETGAVWRENPTDQENAESGGEKTGKSAKTHESAAQPSASERSRVETGRDWTAPVGNNIEFGRKLRKSPDTAVTPPVNRGRTARPGYSRPAGEQGREAASTDSAGKSTATPNKARAGPRGEAIQPPAAPSRPVAGAEPDAETPLARAARKKADAAAQADEQARKPGDVIVVNVMAKPGHRFAGDDILHVLVAAGLKFGDMNIFHQHLAGGNRSPVIFSLANAVNPGTFDLNNLSRFTTPGLSLFLPLPAPINNLNAFERMLEVAQQVQAALGGDLKDDRRNVMTAQTAEHYRQQVRDFELQQLRNTRTMPLRA